MLDPSHGGCRKARPGSQKLLTWPCRESLPGEQFFGAAPSDNPRSVVDPDDRPGGAALNRLGSERSFSVVDHRQVVLHLRFVRAHRWRSGRSRCRQPRNPPESSSPSADEEQATHSRWLIDCSENKSFGQASTQSPHAVQRSSSTTGSDANPSRSRQSAGLVDNPPNRDNPRNKPSRHRQPTQRRRKCPDLRSGRGGEPRCYRRASQPARPVFLPIPISTPRNDCDASMLWPARSTVHLPGKTSPATKASANARQPG